LNHNSSRIAEAAYWSHFPDDDCIITSLTYPV